MDLVSTIRTVLGLSASKTVAGQAVTGKPSKTQHYSWADGTGNDQADSLYFKEATLNGSEELDLAGTLTDIFGDTITFVKVRAILLYNKSSTTGQLLKIGGAAANTFINWVGDATDVVQIGPGGMFLIADPDDGFAVTAGTGDKLKIETTASLTYEIYIIGTSA